MFCSGEVEFGSSVGCARVRTFADDVVVAFQEEQVPSGGFQLMVSRWLRMGAGL